MYYFTVLFCMLFHYMKEAASQVWFSVKCFSLHFRLFQNNPVGIEKSVSSLSQNLR
jgi:hypothetical protein